MLSNARLSEREEYVATDTSNQTPGGESVFSADAATNLPNFHKRAQSPGFAETTRIAGRINASAITKEEHDALLPERTARLQKKYQSSLSSREENRLTYVRWSLDRIEDAKHGAHLDILEDAVSEYEKFLKEVKVLSLRIAQLGAGRD